MNVKPTVVRLPSRSSISHINGKHSPSGKCPVGHLLRDPEDMEHDFTTPGKIGNLECPFAKMTQNGLPDTPNSQDPIAAEFHGDQSSVASNGGLGKCPIRFLDKHSPEEIAQYFENHKHEIPRSHEVCVRRYQHNSDSARALDAKYGNLVNMIQGLGVKHKQYLPNGDEKEQASSQGAVKKWAEDISDEASQPPDTQEEARQSHFERPLREIRVGESPSRPWGISVPVDKPIPASAIESDKNMAERPIQSASIPSPEAPVIGIPQSLLKSQTKIQDDAAAAAVASTTKTEATPKLPNQIVFNGPVFFGYSAEDAAKLLCNLNIKDLQPNP